jgi:hypothetical protein
MVRTAVPRLRPSRELSGPEAAVMMAVALGHVRVNQFKHGRIASPRFYLGEKNVSRVVTQLVRAGRIGMDWNPVTEIWIVEQDSSEA